MNIWTGDEVMTALGLRAVSGEFSISGISIDTRTLEPGNLFIAIEGENFDGHRFVQDSFAKGAAGVIVEENKNIQFQPGQTYFTVPDTTVALQQLGAYARKRSDARVIAITGSAGKTTTKEWLGKVLSNFGETVYSKASLNNHWGVPLSLCELRHNSDFGVFEIGMNHGGEIEPLTKIVNPSIAIITTIAEAHIGHLGSLDAIALEKSQILKGFSDGGVAILNADNPYFEFLKKQALDCGAVRVIGVGRSPNAEVILMSYDEASDGSHVNINASILGEFINYQTPLLGEHFAYNSLMVLTVAKILDLTLSHAVSGFSRLTPIKGRGVTYALTLNNGQTINLVDDAYNANPVSMRAGLLTFKSFTRHANRRIVVLGDMLELGDMSKAAHEGLLSTLEEVNPSMVFTVGTEMRALYDVLPSDFTTYHFDNAEELTKVIANYIEDGDSIYVKGSKGSCVSRVVDMFLETTKRAVA
jgi:UDP-N-acetylmuramoyl-tripeptide--D-alanyl-D-alanine ligase